MNVSVIIPCYNQAHFLAEAIESVLGQTKRAFEIIVIDDGSTDNTSELVKLYPSVRYFHQKNSGLSAARNAGFKASTGDMLIFLDSDDRLPPDTIQAGLTALGDLPDAAFAYGRLRRIAIDGCTISERKEPVRSNYYHDFLKDNYIPTPGMVMFRRSTLNNFGLFDPNLNACEDYDMYLRVVRKKAIVSHPTITIERRVHPQAMSRDAARMLQAVLTVQGRQQRYTRGEKSLRAAFRKGRKWWKQWYGNQLLTQMKIERQQHEWNRYTGNILTLLRYHPALLKKIHGKARQSNSYHFKISAGNSLECVKTPEIASFNDDSRSGPGTLRIQSIKSGGLNDKEVKIYLPDKFLLITIYCQNASQGTRAVLNGIPVMSVMLTKIALQALIPVKSLNESQTHKIFLLG